jgi:two-component system sensor histidine kinase PilS (NtrC family)
LALFALIFASNYKHNSKLWCFAALSMYLLFGLVFIFAWYKRWFRFKQQVLLSGTIDTIAMVLFIYFLGYLQSGFGILLSIPIAMLSILVPGRLSFFFAAVASCMLLSINIFQYDTEPHDTAITFFSTGMYGAFFFATALTSWYFVHWLQMSERLSRHRGRELLNMQRLNEYIVGRLQYGVIYVDQSRHVKLANQAARDFFQYDRMDSNFLLSEMSTSLNQKYSQFLSKKTGTVKQSVLGKPYVRVQFISTSTDLATGVLIIIEDMVLIAQQVQQLKLASLGRFSASIAHELRNPLGIISHAAQLTQEGGQLNAEDLRLNQLIINNCRRMNTVIKNVLQVSRRQQAKQESIELTQFLKQLRDEFCLINTCDILLNIPQNKPKKIDFDRGHLEQILVVLCDNAMQHGHDENGVIQITISLRHEGDHICLLLEDTGPGISYALRHEVFKPFFSTLTTGNGMGLYIAKDLCEINQAHLSLEKTESGCCFSITFKDRGIML